MTDPTEQEIAAVSTAPRVTPADIDANIVGEIYFDGDTVIEGIEEGAPSELSSACVNFYGPDAHSVLEPMRQLTFCVLVLRNGFTVTGESACASPENFDAEIGRKVARANAVQKIWPLLGFELKSRLNT